MGISSDGQICYGIAFEEGYEFPWLEDKWEGDEEKWWFNGVCGYKPPFIIYNNEGEFINDERPPQKIMDEYYNHYDEFKKANPMSVDIVGHCSYDYRMFVVAVKGTFVSSSRGDLTEIICNEIGQDQIKIIIDFCNKYCKPPNDYCEFPEMKPCWLLSSMYG